MPRKETPDERSDRRKREKEAKEEEHKAAGITKRPRGRSRKGQVWDEHAAQWAPAPGTLTAPGDAQPPAVADAALARTLTLLAAPDAPRPGASFQQPREQSQRIIDEGDGFKYELYDGEWDEDRGAHGHGKRTYPDGTILEGRFEDDNLRHGKKSTPEGTVFEGQFDDDEALRDGTITWDDGTVFEGHFVNQGLEGHGKQTEPDGSVYEGEFKHGELHGQGKHTRADGSFYEGQWKDGKRHGWGRSVGAVWEGRWEEDKPVE